MQWCSTGRHWATLIKNPDPKGQTRLCDICDAAEFLTVVKKRMADRPHPAPTETMGVKLELIRRDRDERRNITP